MPAKSFIDSHAHLCDPAFDDDRDAAVQRLRDAGGGGVVCIGESIAAAERAAELAAKYPGFVFATAGVHPHDAAEFDPERDSAAIRELVARGAVAIGECGLDYHYDHSPRPLVCAASCIASPDRVASPNGPLMWAGTFRSAGS